VERSDGELSHIFVQYDNVFPFSRVKEAHLDCHRLDGWKSSLARELISLARGDGPGLDSVD
jgi:hypothetical protein